MRVTRLAVVFLAFYFTFLGGGAYYALFFEVRVVHHFLTTTLLGAWLVHRLWQRRGLPDTGINGPVLAIIVVWLVTAALSTDPRMAFEHVWLPLTHTVLFFIIVDMLQSGRQRLVFEAQFFMAALVIFITGMELSSWLFGLGITPGTSVAWLELGLLPTLNDIPTASMAMGISTLLAGYTAPLVTLTFVWGYTTRQRDYRIVLWLTSALLLVVVLLTQSRGGLLSVGVAVGVFALFRAAQSSSITSLVPPRRILIGGVLVGMVFVGIFVLLTLPAGAEGRSNSGRLDMLRGSTAIALDHAIIGVGPGMFGRAFRDYRDPAIAQDKLASAHNVYANTVAELGIVGTVAGVWLLLRLTKLIQRNRATSHNRGHRTRIEGAAAALIGIGVHSLVDVFTITPIALTIMVLAAYVITPLPKSQLDPRPRGQMFPAGILVTLIVIYGMAWVQVDRAQGHYMASLRADSIDDALAELHAAHTIDPFLNLYILHEAILIAQRSPNSANTTIAEAFERAVTLEPTWDTGWIHLAHHAELSGNLTTAINYLAQAREISAYNTAHLHWARLTENTNTGEESEIIAAYRTAIAGDLTYRLPMAAFWAETPLRLEAVRQSIAQQPLDIQYRVFTVHFPQEAMRLVPETPQSAAEWWIIGEHTLQVNDNPVVAYDYFSQAIALAPRNGDYYAARARAGLRYHRSTVTEDIQRALLFGTRFEYPLATAADLTSDPQIARNLRAQAVPVRVIPQEFAAVLFSRPALFDVPRNMRFPGPGEDAVAIWLEIVANDLARGDTGAAQRTLAFILDHAPFSPSANAMRTILTADTS